MLQSVCLIWYSGISFLHANIFSEFWTGNLSLRVMFASLRFLFITRLHNILATQFSLEVQYISCPCGLEHELVDG